MSKTSVKGKKIGRILAGASLLALGFGAATAAAPVLAQDAGGLPKAGDVVVRARALYVKPRDDKSIGVTDAQALVKDDVVPEIDFSYFLTDNVAFELIAATTRHNVQVNLLPLGRIPVGKVSLLPPTLLLQYHLPVGEHFKPYAGIGVNYTIFYDSKAAAGGLSTETHYKDGFGWAAQLGFDYQLGDSPWMFNVDAKKVFLNTTLRGADRAQLAKVDLDPWIFGIGFGYRF